MSVSIMATEGRPPHIQFEERSLEDRAATEAAGRYVARAVDYVTIRQPGAKDDVEKEAVPWLESLSQNPNMAPQWVDGFRDAYKRWKAGQEITPDGTHVKTWAMISKAQADTLIYGGVLTVEDLAAANEATLQRVGMGARELQYKAREWMAKAKTIEATEKQATELQIRFDQMARESIAKQEELERKNSELAAKLEEFLNSQTVPAPVAVLVEPKEDPDDFLN